MIYEIVVPAAVGSVIGYFTNWLAIKMLFRPHHPKYIFGVRLPFTPGLIPKERERIAKSIGNAVGVHLLDDKTILKAIEDIDIKEYLSTSIDEYVKSANEKELTLRDVVNSFQGGIDENILSGTTGAILDNVSSIDTYFKEFLQSAINSVMKADNKLVELLPEELDAYIDRAIEKNSPAIAGSLKKAIMSESIEEKIKAAIKQYVAAKAGVLGMLGNFINTDSIYDNVKTEIYSLFDDPDVHKEIKLQLMKYKEDILGNSIKDLLSADEEIKQEEITKAIIDLLSSKSVEYLCSEEGKEQLGEKLRAALTGVLETKVSELTKGGKSSVFLKIKTIIIEKLYEISIKSAPKIIDNINIEKLVEDKLNTFDIEFTEKLILDISGKELSAITWLGGVLGLAIGLVQPLINHILNI